ncbi:ATP-dependent DNA ligase [Vermiphilus pyriformis]|uniref:DNA ligase (ATP) n=1 Tax=candidate division TM6 bacterium JCVI TM6SC1 TaxID=1306947 RepID=A0A0D2GPN4_9BACT|nr:hypothetical protein J120_03475 [candidate division TM6 bacterium JCVI TM6SC1]UNE35417.1 MAG: ATP-dependent DNA ligase [Vermiphilus pyriformis]
MKFKALADAFAQIEQESGRIKITHILAQTLSNANGHEAQIICNLSLGQLHPPYIGTQFALAEKSIIKVLAVILSLSAENVLKERARLGDLGLVFKEYASIEHMKHDLDVVAVYEFLVRIENLGGAGSQEAKQHALLELLRQVDGLSGCYIIRIILAKLRLGFSDMTLIDALSFMVTGDKSLRSALEHAYNICVDLGLIAQTLKDHGIDAIKHMEIQLGIPIRPAAAERLPNAKQIIEKIGPCIVEPKIDGFRLQIHIEQQGSNKKIHFFSRNLTDMSDSFPDLYKACEQWPIHSLIAEGEAIVFDPANGRFVPFQETVKRKRKHDIVSVMQQLPLQLFLFDALYINGTSMLDKPYTVRRAELEKISQLNQSSSIQLIQDRTCTTAQEMQGYFDQALAHGLEGLMAKRPDSLYQPGKRNFNWIKLKKHQESSVEDTIDCVILGYYLGSGKRTSFGIGAFLVGVYDKPNDRFETIAKVGTGLSDQDWKILKTECDKYKASEKPMNVVCVPELYPSVWVDPVIVCEIFADEITLSPLHTAGKGTGAGQGFALRFPRFLGYRPDKTATESTQVTEIKRMYHDQKKQELPENDNKDS